MVWIRLCMSCIAFLSVAGAVSFGIVRVAQRLRYIENVFLLSALQKISLVLYWTPIPFACVYFSRISGRGGVSSYSGEFVCSTVPGMTVVFQLTGLIWLAGFLVSAARSGIKMCRLAGLIRGNVPVEDSRYLRVFEECRYRDLKRDREFALQERITARDLRIAHLGSRHFALAERQEKELQSLFDEDDIMRTQGQDGVTSRAEDVAERLQEKLDERDHVDGDTKPDEEIRDNEDGKEEENESESVETENALSETGQSGEAAVWSESIQGLIMDGRRFAEMKGLLA